MPKNKVLAIFIVVSMIFAAAPFLVLASDYWFNKNSSSTVIETDTSLDFTFNKETDISSFTKSPSTTASYPEISASSSMLDTLYRKCITDKVFNMVVIVDPNSLDIPNKRIADYFDFASQLLYDRTCTRINVSRIMRVPFDSDQTSSETLRQATLLDPNIFMSANGFVIFTNNSVWGNTYGGYAFSANLTDSTFGLKEYCNTISYQGETRVIYGSVIDLDHKFARCGYESDEGAHISDSSIGGECRGQVGTPCVFHNGYYMCQNATEDYYASDVRMMTVSTIIHEIMHHFGENGNFDHYGTAVCQTYPVQQRDFPCATSDEAECYFVMCPYTYKNFMEAPNLCGV